MLIPFIIGSIAVFLTYLTRNRQNGIGLKMAFMIFFVFLALRYDYGNDYMTYLDGYSEITSNVQIFFTEMRWEPGWNILHLIFKPFGFFVMVMFMSLATCVVLYRFVRNYVPANYQWFAVFLYVFDPYLFLVPASAMRQNLGIIIFLTAIEFLYKKRIFIYLLLALLAASFHKSGIVLLPFVLLAFINIKINKFLASVFILLYASMYLFGEQVFSVINSFAGAYFGKYAESYLYGIGATVTTGLGLFYSIFQLIAILYYAGLEFAHSEEISEQEDVELLQDEQEGALQTVYNPYAAYSNLAARRLLFKLALISFLFIPLGLQLAIISRINMYFATVLIAVYPIILFTSKSKFFRLILMSSMIAFTLFRFWAFFLSPIWRDKFGTYQTIFSATEWH